MPVSMKDVARAAGVSEGTVSRALADSPRINRETRTRIQHLARRMGYVPSAIARGLAVRRTSTIGAIIMDISDPFIAKMMFSLDRQALARGYTIIMGTAGADPKREMSAIRVLLRQRVDAIIVIDPLVFDLSAPQFPDIEVPLVRLNNMEYPRSVGTDNVAAARAAVGHLLDLGHQRIAYIGGMNSLDESLDRQAGYEQALAERGLPVDPALIVDGDGWSAGGEAGVKRFLAMAQPPTAVFCFNDITAAGALLAAYDARVRVPDDLSLIGFDDSVASHLVPPLTTMAQDTERLAELALEMALALLRGDEPSRATSIPASLIVRKSTAPPRGAR
jgi:DNA-binding LacI/PurR family transcriptional regulator